MYQETTTTPATEVKSGGITEDQAVQQLLGRWTKEPENKDEAEQPQEQAQPEQAQADATDDAEPEGDATETAPDDGEDEIDVAGEKFKVPRAFKDVATRMQAKAKEVEAGATRKFQEAADLRKAVDAEKVAVTQLRQIAEKHTDLLADHRMVTRRLEQIEKADFSTLDDSTLTRINAEYNQLQAAKSRIEGEYQRGVAAMQAEQKNVLKARQEHAEKIVATRIKDWSPAKAQKLAEYAVSRGAPVEVLNSITDPWMVEILDDAAYGRQMREHKSTLEKRVVQTQPTLRPGASTAQPKAAAKVEQAMTRLGKTHSVDDAVAALLARSQMRKK